MKSGCDIKALNSVFSTFSKTLFKCLFRRYNVKNTLQHLSLRQAACPLTEWKCNSNLNYHENHVILHEHNTIIAIHWGIFILLPVG